MAAYGKLHERLGLNEHALGIFYTNEKPPEGVTPRESGRECIFALFNRARRSGETVYFDEQHAGCPGGAYYLGFRPTSMPGIEYFLSCGIPGKMEGERYIRTPELAREYFHANQPRLAPAKYAVFKPVDRLASAETPEVIVFFAPPDILSGLIVLANFASGRADAVSTPFSSGCGAILTRPLAEAMSDSPKAILGLFDVSARPFVEPDILTLAIPTKLFAEMLAAQDESFLITGSWEKIKKRIDKTRVKPLAN